jgi:hypothetical protein
MDIQLTQTELCTAIEHYLNTVVLKERVLVKNVKKDSNQSATGSVLHVVVVTDPAVELTSMTVTDKDSQ